MLETKRCLVLPLMHEDFEEVALLYANQSVRRYLGGVLETDSVKAMFTEMIEPDNQSFYWIVRNKQTSGFIGLLSLTPYHESGKMEVSYQLMASFWKQGYAKETVTAAVSFALSSLALPVVMAETQTSNISSCRLLETIGMKREGTLTPFGAKQAVYSIKEI